MRLRPLTKSFMATLEAYENKNPDPFCLITNESIAFQRNDMFGPNLETIIAKYESMVAAGANQKAIKEAKELHTSLEMLIKARLGIKAKIITDSYLAAVVPNVYVPHNPVIRDDIKHIYEILDDIAGQDKLRKMKNKAVIGTVNTQTAKISGWFSEQELPVYMNFRTLFKDCKLTIPEVTAVLLHELGHAFEAVVFCANVNTTNQIIADLVRHVDSKDYGGDVDYIYSRIKEISPDTTKDIADALASGNKVVMSVATYRLYNGVMKTLMSNKVYDRTGFEAIADNFTSRFGYGLQIIQGLEKLEGKFPEYERSKQAHFDTVMALIFNGVIAVGCLFGALAGVASFPAVIFGSMFAYLSKLIFDTQRPSQKDMTYDNIKDRYIRVRNQLIEQIKDKELPAQAREALLDQIKTTDMIVANKRVFVGYLQKFAILAIPSDRRVVADIAIQQEIERIMSNDIFVAANRLLAKTNK